MVEIASPPLDGELATGGTLRCISKSCENFGIRQEFVLTLMHCLEQENSSHLLARDLLILQGLPVCKQLCPGGLPASIVHVPLICGYILR